MLTWHFISMLVTVLLVSLCLAASAQPDGSAPPVNQYGADLNSPIPEQARPASGSFVVVVVVFIFVASVGVQIEELICLGAATERRRQVHPVPGMPHVRHRGSEKRESGSGEN